MEREDSTLILNDFVTLPIIISDYDATLANRRHASTSTIETSLGALEPNTISSQSTARPKWTTGFFDFAEDLWSRMSGGMKARLREACVEVLKRTEDSKCEPSDHWGDGGDNTRLLDREEHP